MLPSCKKNKQHFEKQLYQGSEGGRGDEGGGGGEISLHKYTRKESYPGVGSRRCISACRSSEEHQLFAVGQICAAIDNGVATTKTSISIL